MGKIGPKKESLSVALLFTPYVTVDSCHDLERFRFSTQEGVSANALAQFVLVKEKQCCTQQGLAKYKSRQRN